MEAVVFVVVIIMLGAAAAVLLMRDFLAVLGAFSVVSLCLSGLFALLAAPDVAMTEAVIGAGLSTVLFALALFRMGVRHSKD